MQTGLLSRPLMLCTSLWSCCKSMDCAPARNWVGLTDLKSVERQFLLIWLNQCRHMQPVAIYGSSIGLWPTLQWQVNTTSEDSSLVSSFCCLPVFSSLSQYHPLLRGPLTSPLQCEKDMFVLTRLIKKWLRMRSHILVFCSCGVPFQALWWFPPTRLVLHIVTFLSCPLLQFYAALIAATFRG